MKLVIDQLDSASGWVGTGSVTISTNAVPSFVAGNQDASLLITFPTGSSGQTATKTITAVDVTNYDTIVLHLWSRNKALKRHLVPSDCSYKLSFGGAEEFFVRVWPGLNIERIDISDITSITEIKFEATHAVEDYLVASHMIARADEVPLDLFTGLKTEIERIREELQPNGLQIGTVTGTAGDTTITLDSETGFKWRYAVLKIVGGGNTETHQIKDIDEDAGTFEMMTTFDDEILLNSFTAAPAYLQFPVEIYQIENEIRVPGMTLYGMEPERIDRGNDEDFVSMAYQSTSFSSDREGKLQVWPIHIALASRHGSLNVIMATIVRTALGRQSLWINGERFSVDFKEVPLESLPSEPFDVLPALEYTVNIEMKEIVWPRTSTVPSDPAVITVTPVTSL